MEAQAPPLGVAPVPTKKRAQWTPQEIPKAAPTNYVGAVFCERYLLRRRIGAGGMSTIYEARDAVLGKRVVVKILRDDLPSDPVDRFRREAHVLVGLSHEHIAQIIDRQDPSEGPRFLVTEYIDGYDLGELLRRGPVPAAAMMAIGLQVCAALCSTASSSGPSRRTPRLTARGWRVRCWRPGSAGPRSLRRKSETCLTS